MLSDRSFWTAICAKEQTHSGLYCRCRTLWAWATAFVIWDWVKLSSWELVFFDARAFSFWSVSSAAWLLKELCARTVIKFWVSHMNAAFLHDFQETGTNCCSFLQKIKLVHAWLLKDLSVSSASVRLHMTARLHTVKNIWARALGWWCRQHWLGCYPKFSKSI